MEAKSWRQRFYAHYTQAPATLFPKFKLGAVIFFIGLVVIYSGYQLLLPSLAQELVTLLGLVLIGVGFTLAMLIQIRMLIGRILRFFVEE